LEVNVSVTMRDRAKNVPYYVLTAMARILEPMQHLRDQMVLPQGFAL